MNKLNRFRIFSLVTIWVLMASLVIPLAVLAEGEVPPAEEPAVTDSSGETPPDGVTITTVDEVCAPESVEGCDEEGRGGEVLEAATVSSGEAPPTEDTAGATPPSEESVTEPGPTEEVTVAEVLEAIPEGTDLVVLDENGEPLPLVSEEAAQVIVSGDPTWCPEGQTPGTDLNDLSQDCTPEHLYFGSSLGFGDGLLEFLYNNPSYSGNGTIYVSWDYDHSLEYVSRIQIDGADLTSLGTHDLTIQGGWDFSTDTLYEPNPYSYFNQTSLLINNWTGNVSLYNLVFSHSEYGLDAYTSGDVTLGNVTADETVFGNGIDLITDGGNVTAEMVSAGGNEYHGMSVEAGGDVSITLSDFYANGSMGSFHEVNYTSGSGLVIDAGGNVTLTNVMAHENANHGAMIAGSYDSDVTITGGQYNDNGELGSFYEFVDGGYSYGSSGGDGIMVNTGGHLELTDVEAAGNALHGVELISQSINSVNVDGGSFNGNGWLGSEYLDAPCYSTGWYCYEFMYGNGLNVHTNGLVTINGVEADSNYGSGAYLVSMDGGNVNVNNSGFDSNGQGVYYYGEGSLLAEYVCTEFGLCETLPTMPLSFLSSEGYYGSSGFNLSFGFDAGDGLFTSTSGDVNLTGASANNNSGDGVHVSNHDRQFEDWTQIENVVVNDSQFNGNGFYSGSGEPDLPIGLEGYLYFTGDNSGCVGFFDCLNYISVYISSESGLQAFAENDITLNNVTANENSFHGAELENLALTSVFANHSHFEANGQGPGSIYFFVADWGEDYEDNYGSGAYIESSGNATLNCNQFIDNANYGADGENVYGTFASNSDTYSGNGSGDTNGSPIFGSTNCEPDEPGGGSGGMTIIVPVTGGAGFPIDCTNPEVFEALLENGDKALFELLCDYDGMLIQSPLDQLPDEIPSQYEYVAGMDITVLLDGGVVVPLPAGASVTPAFKVEDANLEYAILFWNGSAWEEVEGGELDEDGFFSAKVDFTGTFVLVTK